MIRWVCDRQEDEFARLAHVAGTAPPLGAVLGGTWLPGAPEGALAATATATAGLGREARGPGSVKKNGRHGPDRRARSPLPRPSCPSPRSRRRTGPWVKCAAAFRPCWCAGSEFVHCAVAASTPRLPLQEFLGCDQVVLGLRFRSLAGRRLKLIDCQNLFCEVDKYARVAPSSRRTLGSHPHQATLPSRPPAAGSLLSQVAAGAPGMPA